MIPECEPPPLAAPRETKALHPNDTGVRASPLALGNYSDRDVLNQLLCGGISGAGPAVGFKCCNSLWGFLNFGRSDLRR
ncbi:hypothetical protein QUA70_01625 [Microcoleus sp. LAD1_D5]|uniref:hypothetical protein n=1 Tax=unclassified Microcoleus TaxID=2642155 RepID=UPI002FD362A6